MVRAHANAPRFGTLRCRRGESVRGQRQIVVPAPHCGTSSCRTSVGWSKVNVLRSRPTRPQRVVCRLQDTAGLHLREQRGGDPAAPVPAAGVPESRFAVFIRGAHGEPLAMFTASF